MYSLRPQDVEPHLLAQYRDYARLSMRPLWVGAELGTPYVPSDPPDRLNLDGLLSWAVLRKQPFPVHFSGAAIIVPLPLACLWVSPEGRPLWAASQLRPLVAPVHGRSYWHKRYPVDRADFAQRVRAVTSRGRYKEYRIPIGEIVAAAIGAVVVGHQQRVQQLLELITHLGKKPTQGKGRVLRWTVEPLDSPEETVIEAILQARPVPAAYWMAQGITPLNLVHRGWTPPYWHAPTWGLCTEPGA